MAATTPTILEFVSGRIYRLGGRALIQWSAYDGAGTLDYQRVRIYDDGSRTTTLWDSGLRPVDNHISGNGWLWWWPETLNGGAGAASATTYYVGVMVENSNGEQSSESTLVDFTMETAELTGAAWRAAQ